MIGMGLMNLALAAIVDKATDARKSNEEERLKLKLKVIRVLFSEMDADGSGSVGIEEFMRGLQDSPDFESALEVMGIRVEDIRTVFQMMDLDNSGAVSYDEFVDNLSKMKNEESFMILLYIKHFMLSMEMNLEEMVRKVVEGLGSSLRSAVVPQMQKESKIGADAHQISMEDKSKWAEAVAEDSMHLRCELDSLRAKVNEDVMFHVTDMTQRLGSRLVAQQEQLDQLAAETTTACRISLAQQQSGGKERPASGSFMPGCCASPPTPVSVPIKTSGPTPQSACGEPMSWETAQLGSLGAAPGSHARPAVMGALGLPSSSKIT